MPTRWEWRGASLVTDRVVDRVGPSRFDRVWARPLLHFGELVMNLGGDRQHLFTKVGLPVDFDESSYASLSYRQIVELLNRAAEACACPDFGMRLALRQGGHALSGPLGDLMRHAGNLGEALAGATTYSHAHSPAAGIWAKPSRHTPTTLLGHDILVEGLPDKAQAMEMILLLGRILISELTQDFVRPHRVLFRHQPVAPAIVYRRNFQCEVRFGQPADGLLLRNDDFAHPITHSDAGQFRAARAYIEARFAGQTSPFHARVRGIITHFLGNTICDKAIVAQELNLHPRALHRNLARESTTFQHIKDEVRRDFLLYYISHTQLDCSAISERLGFSEQAVMTRFCHKWFGCSPRELRNLRSTLMRT